MMAIGSPGPAAMAAETPAVMSSIIGFGTPRDAGYFACTDAAAAAFG
jgi:hypothetical protein